MTLSNKMYNILQWFVYVLLPAFATLYLGLDQVWGLPAEEKVVATIALISTFIGVTLKISAVKYANTNDGQIVIDSQNQVVLGVSTPDLTFTDIEGKKNLRLKVTPSSQE